MWVAVPDRCPGQRLATPARSPAARLLPLLVAACLLLGGTVHASVGDRLPEFQDCVELCKQENCYPETLEHKNNIPRIHRLLRWTCPDECDYTCQHIITASRLGAGYPVVQFHGKWPFQRFLGAQEPLSVIFSAGNLWAHASGLRQLRRRVPGSYSLRRFYVGFALAGLSAWTFSIIFHTRDSRATEQLDYFAAGASVLYGLFLAVVRIFRLDRRRRSSEAISVPSTPDSGSAIGRGGGGGGGSRSSTSSPGLLRVWMAVCLTAYACHVAYLKLVRWDYTYNMAANVAVGVVQNLLWSWFSWTRYRRERRAWAAYPGLTVAWITMAMSLELFDFPPLWGALDAHSLWHLGTIGPTMLWYNFLVKDSLDDIAAAPRLKE
ncbi:hypothetical protein GGTG_04010 [Gaeumannomyces tritici R3-111a-1]|uniref:Post-GPI attachment to proteins factor 3 n=1 Tax=Gaeumannomyces tritici (strain R3-111a-1) TaxID=644352 RepID=J3NRW2_GAET3|nr:hypothetical protein GGTG_04010 [Gaeumannomyces tritici R3-111a-1]EJT78918.1 hypothetical protein GGTG_04010 [Gaeumannomyces tritici R3-111a-1]